MRFFPDREIMLRTDGRVRHVKISKTLQLSSFGAVLVLAGWAIFASFSFFIHDEIVVSKNKEILEARMVYRSLLSEVSDYQSKFSNLTSELGKNHGLMLDLVEKNAALQQNLRSAKTRLQSSNSRHEQIVAARANLKSKLSGIENEMKALNSHNFNLKGNLNSVTTDLESALSERNFARAQGKKLSHTVTKLENDLDTLQKSEKDILVKLTERTKDNIDDIEFVLKRTGINVAKLLKANDGQIKKNFGQGGPFIALTPNTEPAQRLKATLANLNSHLKQFGELQLLMKRLPIAAPLDYFTISSHYGKRRDPINKRWASHYGIDFGGAKRTSVFVTAPGKVTYAGRKGKYGKLIEVDHGLGFKTRYGHLHKILVKRGQKVDYRTKIGLMGSTGRSTGPHLHYEITVKGKHQNPWRFIKAGRYVYKRQ
ncbi:MAG: peptidoglycan DD-metalloendopeptidase family protein [Rhodospirillaceae bacterium]|nr:peptidoglycan DD-metalloendopeptidase family protein [Rhodospirillaceae bacterium]MBT4940859.1 peptidoglycan DD-metalloendopeptidase family protein [Rhodospirillaceae bacterium]MBT5940609.1 peptidoglycan DD-metalloendopeptidase family protein [Rhodospirillaceae bacterium]MBT7268674.1 peptidoglycan DD-metalloendopeptidase family protein [Rhodospirillaceae bacterium]